MSLSNVERKALETKRKAEKGLRRRSFWLSNESIKIIEKYKTQNEIQTNDDALNQIINHFGEMMQSPTSNQSSLVSGDKGLIDSHHFPK